MRAITALYFVISPNCFSATTEIDAFNPKPATISAVQPATPITVIRNLALYLKRFLAVTLDVKFICFHINGIFSRRIRLPGLGALGRIRVAALSFNSFKQVNIATAQVAIIATADDINTTP